MISHSMLQTPYLKPDFEHNLLSQGYDIVVGIDEAGRGPWAGPVTVAAFAFCTTTKIVDFIRDSKNLSPKRRAKAFSIIKTKNAGIEIVAKDVKTIDRIGIGRTIEVSIAELININLQKYPNEKIKFLIDGYFACDFEGDFEFIKKGDSKYYSIASASIIAKVTRDNQMFTYAKQFPQYGFENHVGYGTKKHRQALQKHGPCPIHRTSFKPIARINSKF